MIMEVFLFLESSVTVCHLHALVSSNIVFFNVCSTVQALWRSQSDDTLRVM